MKYNYSPESTTDSAYHMVDFKDYDMEPQRSNNFEVQFSGMSDLVTSDKGNAVNNASDTIRLACAQTATPQFSVDTLKIRRGNTEVKFAGQVTYDDIPIKLNDFIGRDVERVMDAWHSKVFNPRTQNIGPAGAYKKTGFLMEFSADHQIVRRWQLYGCWPSKVDFGEYSSDNSGQRQISATIVYDYAVLLDD